MQKIDNINAMAFVAAFQILDSKEIFFLMLMVSFYHFFGFAAYADIISESPQAKVLGRSVHKAMSSKSNSNFA